MRVTQEQIEAELSAEYWFTADCALKDCPVVPGLEHVTICILVLKNGMKVVGVNEGPIDPSTFDAEIGRKYARQKAVDQIWPMLGYELRTRIQNSDG